MGVKTGIQRISTVIRWLCIAWLALGLFLWLAPVGRADVWMFAIYYVIPAGAGLLLAYVIDGFGTKES